MSFSEEIRKANQIYFMKKIKVNMIFSLSIAIVLVAIYVYTFFSLDYYLKEFFLGLDILIGIPLLIEFLVFSGKFLFMWKQLKMFRPVVFRCILAKLTPVLLIMIGNLAINLKVTNNDKLTVKQCLERDYCKDDVQENLKNYYQSFENSCAYYAEEYLKDNKHFRIKQSQRKDFIADYCQCSRQETPVETYMYFNEFGPPLHYSDTHSYRTIRFDRMEEVNSHFCRELDREISQINKNLNKRNDQIMKQKFFEQFLMEKSLVNDKIMQYFNPPLQFSYIQSYRRARFECMQEGDSKDCQALSRRISSIHKVLDKKIAQMSKPPKTNYFLKEYKKIEAHKMDLWKANNCKFINRYNRYVREHDLPRSILFGEFELDPKFIHHFNEYFIKTNPRKKEREELQLNLQVYQAKKGCFQKHYAEYLKKQK